MGLSGRHVGIDGSSSRDDQPEPRARAHATVRALVRAILSAGGGVVTFVSGDPRADDDEPDTALTFIWTLLSEVDAYSAASPDRGSLCRAVLSPRTPADRIPPHRQDLWHRLLERGAVEPTYLEEKDHLGVYLRTEQARCSDALVVLGGGKGVQNLADLHFKENKPVIPLDAALRGACHDGPGARRLNSEALVRPERFAPAAPERLRRELPLLSFRPGGEPSERIAERIARLLADLLDAGGSGPAGPLSSQMLEIHEAVVQGGLAVEREALLAGINVEFRAGLTVTEGGSPAGRLLTDLDAMFQARRLTDGSEPLRQWLQNARRLLDPKPQALVMERWLRCLFPPR